METMQVEKFMKRLLEEKKRLQAILARNTTEKNEIKDEVASASGGAGIAEGCANGSNILHAKHLLFYRGEETSLELIAVERAILRVNRGEYGKCTLCDGDIGEKRLDAMPWAWFCIGCQEAEESARSLEKAQDRSPAVEELGGDNQKNKKARYAP